MDKENNSTKCLPCSECSFSQVVIVECNSTQNRECSCPPGKFFDEDLLFCKKCSKCPVGEGVVAACTSTKDTKCQPCSKVCIIFNSLKTLSDWSLGKQLICLPRISVFPEAEPRETFEAGNS